MKQKTVIVLLCAALVVCLALGLAGVLHARSAAALRADAAAEEEELTRQLAGEREALKAAEAELEALRAETEPLRQQLKDTEARLYALELEKSIQTNSELTLHPATGEDGDAMQYMLYEPHGLDEAEPHPMLVYLHGSGCCGSDLQMIYGEESLPTRLARKELTPNALVLIPQCRGDSWTDVAGELMELIRTVAEEKGVDTKRISITGFSLGGIGCFSMLVRYPGFFSAAAPFAATYGAPADCAVIDAPLRIFHGALDDGMGFNVVQINRIVNDNGGKSKLTLFPSEGHMIQGHYLDDGGEIVQWLISQSR